MIEEIFEKLLYSLDQQGQDEREDDWSEDVSTSLESLRESYDTLTVKDRAAIDYGELATQAAYVFAYAIGRAEFTYQLLKRHRAALGAPIFSGDKVTITSIGGGPGSEIAGLVKYLLDPESDENVKSIKYWVLDKDKAWEHLCQSVVDSLEAYIPVELNFIAVDLCKPKSFKNISLAGDDMIILSFIISELCALTDKDKAESTLRELYQTLDNGAKIFYNDSNASSFYYFFNDTRKFVKGLGKVSQKSEVVEEICIDLNFGETYIQYIENLDATPHLTRFRTY